MCGVLLGWLNRQSGFVSRFIVLCATLVSERFDWLPGLKNYFPDHVPGIRKPARQPFISWVSARGDRPGLNTPQRMLRVLPGLPTPKSESTERILDLRVVGDFARLVLSDKTIKVKALNLNN